jgi:hypothetical protein
VVENPGEALRAGANKPLNTPELVRVTENTDGLPVAVRARQHQRFNVISDKWRLDDEWWRPEPVSRCYYALRLASGQKLVVFKDLKSGSWYRQSY